MVCRQLSDESDVVCDLVLILAEVLYVVRIFLDALVLPLQAEAAWEKKLLGLALVEVGSMVVYHVELDDHAFLAIERAEAGEVCTCKALQRLTILGRPCSRVDCLHNPNQSLEACYVLQHAIVPRAVSHSLEKIRESACPAWLRHGNEIARGSPQCLSFATLNGLLSPGG